MKTFQQIGTEHGELVARKNDAYGDSIGKAGAYLRLLYPDGIRPEQYCDAVLLARDFDKNMRIANHRDAFGENPYSDKIGYAMLGYHLHQSHPEESTSCRGNANGAVLPSSDEPPASAEPNANATTAPRPTRTTAHEPSPQPDGYSTPPESATAATATVDASASADDQPSLPAQPRMADDPKCGALRRMLTIAAKSCAERNGRQKPDINDLYNAAIRLLWQYEQVIPPSPLPEPLHGAYGPAGPSWNPTHIESTDALPRSNGRYRCTYCLALIERGATYWIDRKDQSAVFCCFAHACWRDQ